MIPGKEKDIQIIKKETIFFLYVRDCPQIHLVTEPVSELSSSSAEDSCALWLFFVALLLVALLLVLLGPDFLVVLRGVGAIIVLTFV